MLSFCSQTLNGAVPSMGTCAYVRGRRLRRSYSAKMGTVVALFCLFAVPSRADVMSKMVKSVKDATKQLSNEFEGIRTDILGADALAAEYKRVGFDYTPLDIPNFLSNEYAAEHINTVLGLMRSISASSSSDTVTPQDCCSGSNQSEVCCHGCSEDNLLSAITDAFSVPSLDDVRVELDFGHFNGTLLRHPTPQPPSECTTEDSNLQPWYMDMVRTKPLEVVLLIDANDFVNDVSDTQTLRSAAAAVLDSLTLHDKVQAILLGEKVQQYKDESGSSKVLPVCSSYLQKLRDFIIVTSVPRIRSKPARYSDAFTTAFNTLNNNTNSDKLILFFTSASNLFVSSSNPSFDGVLVNVSARNSAMMNTAVISAYFVDRTRALHGNIDRIRRLTRQPIEGSLTELDSENAVRNYYEVFQPAPRTHDVLVKRDINRREVASLSLSLALTNNTELIGIFHARLPWELLFPNVDESLKSGQGHSHFFIINERGEILYHPLVPGNFQSAVSVASIESQEVLDMLERSISTEAPFEVSATKPALTPVSVRSKDRNSFISRQVTMRYSCSPLGTNEMVLYACVAVVQGDEVTAELKNGEAKSLYSSDPERLPLYHTSEIPDGDQCFHYCSISTRDKLSVQLTGPIQPPEDVDLATINKFISGRSDSTPSWVPEGVAVANELAVLSVVGDTWRNVDSSSRNNVTDYVVRRHLATPSGLYLTFPFARLSPDFAAPFTEWFILSSAHPHTLTLTPPRLDALREGGYVVSAGVAITTPPQEDNGNEGRLLAVVATDLTLPSLRVLVESSMPLCQESGYDCFLLDDQGNILYHDVLLTSDFQAEIKEPVFLVRPSETIIEFRMILVSILNELVAFKRRCIDYLDQDVRQRLFFSFDLDNNEVHAMSSNGIEYVVRNVPGTNAFLGIVRKTGTSIDEPFCFCSKTCQTCERNETSGCECPCQCPEDCRTPHSFPACPPTLLESHQLARNGTASVSNEGIAPFCSVQDCSCKTEATDCDASRDCHWCSERGQCRHMSECCSRSAATSACCTQSPFTILPACMSRVCMADVDPPSMECDDSEVSDTNNTASIVGGVLGAVLVLALIGILAAFFLWHQFCRKGLYEEDQKEENAFDFSKTKLKAKNPIYEDTLDTKAIEANSEDHNSSQQLTEATGDVTTL